MVVCVTGNEMDDARKGTDGRMSVMSEELRKYGKRRRGM